MAKDKKSFIMYADQQGVFKQLPDDVAGRLIKHIFSYVNDENPMTEELIINVAFEPIKQSLKRDLKRWEDYIEKQSLNGKKGGRPPKAKETQKTQAFLEKPKKADSVNVSVSDNVNDNVNILFEEVWSAYGRVGNKKTSKDKWKTLKPKEREEIQKHIPRYINNHKSNDKLNFVPHFTTYLNQRRWEDELPYQEINNKFELKNLATLDDD